MTTTDPQRPVVLPYPQLAALIRNGLDPEQLQALADLVGTIEVGRRDDLGRSLASPLRPDDRLDCAQAIHWRLMIPFYETFLSELVRPSASAPLEQTPGDGRTTAAGFGVPKPITPTTPPS